MQDIILILTSVTTWETLGFNWVIVLLCSRPIHIWVSNWIHNGNLKIQEDIQSATQLEQEADSLLQQYQNQALNQRQQLALLKKQNSQELCAIKADIAKKTADEVQRQKDATTIHIRLVATQHQQKMMAGLLDKFTENVSNYFKKQKKENADANIQHLFNAMEKNPEIFKEV